MKRFVTKRIVTLAIICVAAHLLPSYVCVNPATADTDGPGEPGAFGGCPGNDDAIGPCSDPNDYTSSGVGNGLCGRCGDMTYSYIGGSCTGQDQVEQNNCNDCTLSPKTFVRNYESTPVGSLEYAAQYAVWIACVATSGAVDIALGAACVGVCGTAGIATWGAACWACIVGESATVAAGLAVCECAFDEFAEDCDYVGTDTFGSTSACS